MQLSSLNRPGVRDPNAVRPSGFGRRSSRSPAQGLRSIADELVAPRRINPTFLQPGSGSGPFSAGSIVCLASVRTIGAAEIVLTKTRMPQRESRFECPRIPLDDFVPGRAPVIRSACGTGFPIGATPEIPAVDPVPGKKQGRPDIPRVRPGLSVLTRCAPWLGPMPSVWSTRRR